MFCNCRLNPNKLCNVSFIRQDLEMRKHLKTVNVWFTSLLSWSLTHTRTPTPTASPSALDDVGDVPALGYAELTDAFLVGLCVVLPFVYRAIGLHSYVWKHHCNWCYHPSDKVKVPNLSLSLFHSSSNSGN